MMGVGQNFFVTCSSFHLVTRPPLFRLLFANMSSTATTSKQEDTPKPMEPPKEGEQIPPLSVLEEDDEFEEFDVQGE